MKCREVRSLFFLYADSELEARLVQEINEHLEGCPECRRRWEFETAVKESFRRAAFAPAEGAFDWTAVVNRVREAGMQTSAPGRGPLEGPRRKVAAIVIAFAAVGVLLFLLFRPRSAVELAVESAAEHHAKLVAGESPLQVRGGPEAVRRFYRGWLAFEVIAPGSVPGGAAGNFELLGARRCTFLGGPVAFLVYVLSGPDARKAEITVVLGPRHPPEELLTCLSESEKGIVRGEASGVRAVLTTVHGLLFVAAGAVPYEDLERLAEAFRAASPEKAEALGSR